ncbi:MAG: family type secretion target [Microbacterium sp.]|jgi:WXG100 family type VII secretion target|nr:family type secretion target [Microbacterium sp.]
MADITVKPDRVDSTAAAVESGAAGIESQLQILQGAERQLLGAWTGDAATAYQGAQDDWVAQMRTLAGVARAAADAARTAAAAYRDADDAVGRAWGV